jgi:serine/threonine protein kinase
MSVEPRALEPGTLLAERFELQSELGRGAFGIVYLARDLHRNDSAVVKELAPAGTVRTGSHITLPSDSAQRLRQNFLNEAYTILRLRIPGVLPVRAAFAENGTAYFATDHLPNARSLEAVLREQGPMPIDGALDILYQCLETLEAIHAKGILHRDIKPSNILVNSRGEATLIDFGAAREWQADSLSTHTVLFTPTYAPLEQMAERARRGPPTDLFSLCATFYELVSGRKPEGATDRATGALLTPLGALLDGVDATVAGAIERGLALKYTDRPQSVEDLRALLRKETLPSGGLGLLELDAKAVRLQKFSFAKRQCPACSGILSEPKPLRRGECPVCHKGTIKTRPILRATCPFCRNAPLRRKRNEDPLRTCPHCGTGWLTIKKKGLLSKDLTGVCPDCNSVFTADQLTDGLRRELGRSAWVWHCDGCGAQLDERPDGRLLAKVQTAKCAHRELYPEEWDCVAAGLEPGAGNAECSHCGADFYSEGNRATLLGSSTDPFGFALAYAGRNLELSDMQWLAVGKSSPEPGFVCEQCSAEFDREGEYLRLIRTTNGRLSAHMGEPNTLADWHRIAQDLPRLGSEGELEEILTAQIAASYVAGEIGFDDANSIVWKGSAELNGGSGTLLIDLAAISFGGMLRKRKWPLDALRSAKWEGGLELSFKGEPDPHTFLVEPVVLTVSLESGKYSAELTGAELAQRLARTM